MFTSPQKGGIILSGIIIVTCSGISSTGKLTSQAALVFMQRYPGVFEKHIPASKMNCSYEEILRDSSQMIVVDGCTECCAKEKLSSRGLTPDLHIIATDLGIEKRGTSDPEYAEIEKLVLAVKKSVRELE